MNKLVAVYGSLRKGLGNHCVLGDSEFVGDAKTLPKFEMFSLGGFPGIRSGDSEVVIEVYRVTSPNIADGLDCLEGFRAFGDPDNFYDKEFVSTPWGDAEIYTLNDDMYDDSPLVEDGDWYKYVASRY